MSSSTSAPAAAVAKSVKKVAKKEEAAAPVAAAVPATPAAEPKAKKAAAKAAAAAPAAAAAVAPAVVSSTPVVQAAAAAAPAAPATSLDEDLKAVTTYLNTLRETVTNLLGQVKRLDKRVHREIKDARKRRRRVKVEEGVDAPKRAPSIFERPVQVTDELCAFLAQPKGTLMSRSQVTKGVNNYVKENNLKNKHDIKPDAALKKLLSIDQEPLTYFNLQRYLNRHYVKAAPVATA
jgi:chromatin remodeling complex protein RSC6